MKTEWSSAECADIHALLAREWLETNGRGSYASSTVAGSHSRRYHGLLVANLPPPADGRHVLLSKIEDSVLDAADRDGNSGAETFLTCHHFPGVLAPEPVPLPERFIAGLCPEWTYRLPGGARITRAVLMPRGRDAVLFRYTLHDSDRPLRLRVKPFLACRRNHALMRKNDAARAGGEPRPDGICLAPYDGLPPVCLRWTPGRLRHCETAGVWYENFEYLEERRRGFDCREDLFLPVRLELLLLPGEPLTLAATAGELDADPGTLWNAELEERRRDAETDAAWLRQRLPFDAIGIGAALLRAGRAFSIRTPAGRPALLAGYHWFEDWGRDTMIALPGCLFQSPRREEGFAILCAFAEHEREGLLPNFINPDGSASYNSVDAALWFFRAVQHYLEAGGNAKAVRKRLWPVMRRILKTLARGLQQPPVCMDGDGLLWAGSPETQLTWMDATAHGRPVTPRWGMAVEINALWHNALAFSCELAEQFEDKKFSPPAAPKTVAAAFRRHFWLEDRKFLADCINENGTDASLRPNQIFAVAVPYSPLTKTMMRAVLDTVTEHLLTPCGLRTLAPFEPAFRPRYEGGPDERDAAYHQGTVWPWLLGGYADALIRVHGPDSKPAKAFRLQLETFLDRHLAEAGLGCVSEIFDATDPQRPDGCIAQAWSAGELLRAWLLLHPQA